LPFAACNGRETEGNEFASVAAHNLGKENTMSTQKPTLLAYAVKERGKGKKAIWTRIGAAWPHGKSAGLSIELEALPLDGRVVLLPPKADENAAPAASAEEEAETA
jgi:hypothetical protein